MTGKRGRVRCRKVGSGVAGSVMSGDEGSVPCW